jgi:hypothetical protein
MGIYVFLTEITSAVRRRCRLRLVSRCGNNVGRQRLDVPVHVCVDASITR